MGQNGQTCPTDKSGPPWKVDQSFRMDRTDSVLDWNFQKF